MHSGNTHVQFDAVPFDAVATLLTASSTPATARYQDADAITLMEPIAENRVVAAHPTSTASAYHLASMPLTAIDLRVLPDNPPGDAQFEGYDVLVLGQIPHRKNRSLSEYT